MFKNFKQKVAIVIAGVLLVMAFPAVAHASTAAITAFSIDRSSINAGQAVTFSLTTTAQVNFVFADVGGVRVQGVRQVGNNWQLVVSPATTQNITVVAGPANSAASAATVTVPITVTAAGTNVTTGINSPGATFPGGTGPLAIHSIVETPAMQDNHVRLTVVTGQGVNEVWVRFDGNLFRRGQEQVALRTNTARTWIIDFHPQNWATQTLQVGANTAYSFAGATLHNHTLALAAPFARPATSVIEQVTVANRETTLGGQTTFTIRTNVDAEFVWITDDDGIRYNAARIDDNTAFRTWTVSFAPQRTGNILIHANNADTLVSAATRNERVTVRANNAVIFNATAARVEGTVSSVYIQVTTNQFGGRVWVELPDGRRPMLTHQSGTGPHNRVWSAEVHDIAHLSSLQVRVSENENLFNNDYSRTVIITGGAGVGPGNITLTSWNGDWLHSASISHSGSGNPATMTIHTLHAGMTDVWVQSPWGTLTATRSETSNALWTIEIPNFWFAAGQSSQLTFNVADPVSPTAAAVTATWVN